MGVSKIWACSKTKGPLPLGTEIGLNLLVTVKELEKKGAER